MGHDRLFVLQVVIAIEEQWFAAGTSDSPICTQRRYRIDDLLFAAHDEEAAYRTAADWVTSEGFADQNHDGLGDLTRIFAVGIHQLEEVVPVSHVAETANELYGISLPGFYLGDVDANGVPIVRAKDEMEVFRLQRIVHGRLRST